MNSDLPLLLLAIDPSVNNLGWAAYNLESSDVHDPENWLSGVIHPRAGGLPIKWVDTYDQLLAALRAPAKSDPWLWPTHLVAEWPMFFAGQRGHVAAKNNDTIGLAAMVAGVAGWFHLPAENVTLLTPQQWKSQSPKSVTRNRLIAFFPSADFDGIGDDEADALGLALHWLKRQQGPSLADRHLAVHEEFVRLVHQAKENSKSNAAWHAKVSTIIRRRRDLPKRVIRQALASDFQIPRKQVETILQNG